MSGMQPQPTQTPAQQRTMDAAVQPVQQNTYQPNTGSGKGGGQPATSPYKNYQSIYNAPLNQAPAQQMTAAPITSAPLSGPAIQTMVPQQFAVQQPMVQPAAAPLATAVAPPDMRDLNRNNDYGTQ